MSDKTDKMIGVRAIVPHKNTARCKKVNDRLRRRVKRMETGAWKRALKAGDLANSLIVRRGGRR